jgi:hypothetical protein
LDGVKSYEVIRREVNEEKEGVAKYSLPSNAQAVVMDIKFSVDKRYMAVKRGEDILDIYSLPDMNLLTKIVKKAKNQNQPLLGFYWTNPSNLLLIYKTGIECFSITINKGPTQIKLIKEVKKSINWFVYSPQVRILIYSTGNRNSVLRGFHFLKKSGTMNIAKFDVLPKNFEANISPEDILIVQLYSGLYCIYDKTYAQSAKSSRELVLYHLSKDKTTPKYTIDLTHIPAITAFSIIDNLIVTHNADQQVSMIYDIQIKDPQHPQKIPYLVVAPLPIEPPVTFSRADMLGHQKYIIAENYP